MLQRLMQDETGFIISAELVLVATLPVIGVIVGLSEVHHAVVGELNDVADAIGSANQSYGYSGFSKVDGGWGLCGMVTPDSGINLHRPAGRLRHEPVPAACNPPTMEFPEVRSRLRVASRRRPLAPHAPPR